MGYEIMGLLCVRLCACLCVCEQGVSMGKHDSGGLS